MLIKMQLACNDNVSKCYTVIPQHTFGRVHLHIDKDTLVDLYNEGLPETNKLSRGTITKRDAFVSAFQLNHFKRSQLKKFHYSVKTDGFAASFLFKRKTKTTAEDMVDADLVDDVNVNNEEELEDGEQFDDEFEDGEDIFEEEDNRPEPPTKSWPTKRM